MSDIGCKAINVCERLCLAKCSALSCFEVIVNGNTAVGQRVFIREWTSMRSDSSTHSAGLHEV